MDRKLAETSDGNTYIFDKILEKFIELAQNLKL